MGLFKRVSEDGATAAVFQDHEGAMLVLQGDMAGASEAELTVTWVGQAAAAPAEAEPVAATPTPAAEIASADTAGE